MRHATIRNADLAFEFSGAGEPVLLIHGAVLADSFVPLMQEADLNSKYLLIRYHRRGYGGSSRIAMPWSIEQHASDAVGLLDQLGIRKTHVVGHSVGAAVALEIALDFPERVASLTLMELGLPSVPSAHAHSVQMKAIERLYELGDPANAIDQFLYAVGGPEYRRIAEKTLPAGSFDHAIADGESIFIHELPAVRAWNLDKNIAVRVTKPSMVVTGTASLPLFQESAAILSKLLPDSQSVKIPGATHALHMQAPRKVSAALQRFFAENVIVLSAPA